ncbi:MAG: hypothetical protein E6K13_00820 [Methanobacteriota archaeon]|nr:MAG: hypothetical protein E6K13_00820 [Euryarchaeota archaeon]
MRTLLLLAVSAALVLVMPPFARSTTDVSLSDTPDPFTCVGYPEPRWYLGSQGWWRQNLPGEAPEGRHVHAETCFPLHQVVSGILHLDVVVKLHNQPGKVSMVRIQAFNVYTLIQPVSLECPTNDCTFIVPMDVDTTKIPNGNREFRITANIRAGDATFGERFYQTTRWHAVIDNSGSGGSSGKESRSRSPGAAGWYQGLSYANLYCGPDDGFKLISKPVAGVVTITCRFTRSTAFATIDPDFHHGSSGTVLLNARAGTWTITIDSTTLTNGPHRLFLSTSASNGSGTLTGALVLTFNVQNS